MVVMAYRDFDVLRASVERYHYLGQERLTASHAHAHELGVVAEGIRGQLPNSIQQTVVRAHGVLAELIKAGGERGIKLPALPPSARQNST